MIILDGRVCLVVVVVVVVVVVFRLINVAFHIHTDLKP